MIFSLCFYTNISYVCTPIYGRLAKIWLAVGFRPWTWPFSVKQWRVLLFYFSVNTFSGSKSTPKVSYSNFLDRKLNTDGTLERFCLREKLKEKLRNNVKFCSAIIYSSYTYFDKTSEFVAYGLEILCNANHKILY